MGEDYEERSREQWRRHYEQARNQAQAPGYSPLSEADVRRIAEAVVARLEALCDDPSLPCVIEGQYIPHGFGRDA